MPFDSRQFVQVAQGSCDKELAFLLTCAEPKTDAQCIKKNLSPGTGLDLLKLFELARLNKLVNVLPERAQTILPNSADYEARVMKARLITTLFNRSGLEVASEISRRLNAHNIEHIHIKGPLQQIELYDDILRKPSADVDILVHPKDQSEAVACIENAGFSLLDSHISLWWRHYLQERHFRRSGSETIVDLHHGLKQPGLPTIHGIHRIIEDSREVSFEGFDFRIPHARHLVLLTSISLCKAFLSREPALSSVFDFGAAMQRLSLKDRQELDQTARDMRLGPSLALARRFYVSIDPSDQSVAPSVLPNLNEDQLLKMIATPWVAGLPWPRRDHLLSTLCGGDRYAYARERVQSLVSEGLRITLEQIAQRRGCVKR